jgi:transcription elongation factor Elf1
MTQTQNTWFQTLQPRANRPLVHKVKTLGRPSAYDRSFARTMCGQRLSGWIGNTQDAAKITCKSCKEA